MNQSRDEMVAAAVSTACALGIAVDTDVNAETALDGYGEHDRDVVDALAAAVMVWITPWAVYADSLDRTLNDWTTRRLEWLERRFA